MIEKECEGNEHHKAVAQVSALIEYINVYRSNANENTRALAIALSFFFILYHISRSLIRKSNRRR